MPPGATVGTQMYWHQAPAPKAPWKDSAELNEYLKISHKVGGHCAITPYHMSLRAPGQKPNCTVAVDDLRKGLDELAETKGVASRDDLRQQTHNIHTGITVDRTITPLSAVNEMLVNAGTPPVTEDEALDFVDAVLEEEAVPRLSTVMKKIAKSRGLKLTGITVSDMRKKRSRFTASDVVEGGALLIIDKEDPLFVLAYRAHELDGQPAMLTLVSPPLDPKPFRRTVRVLNRVARFECDFYYVSKDDGGEEPQDEDPVETNGGADGATTGEKRKRDEGRTGGPHDEEDALPNRRSKRDTLASQRLTQSSFNPQNPFSKLPKLVNQKMRRKNKRTKHTWRVRLIEVAKRQELYDKAHLFEDDDDDEDSGDDPF